MTEDGMFWVTFGVLKAGTVPDSSSMILTLAYTCSISSTVVYCMNVQYIGRPGAVYS